MRRALCGKTGAGHKATLAGEGAGSRERKARERRSKQLQISIRSFYIPFIDKYCFHI